MIWCCGCNMDVEARLTDGSEIYPRRSDLRSLPFWKCDSCGNYVGCHHKMKSNPTKPLGVIATKEVRKARGHIHDLIDPVWQSGTISRGRLYKKISKKLGCKYHTSSIRSIEEARIVYKFAKEIIVNDVKSAI